MSPTASLVTTDRCSSASMCLLISTKCLFSWFCSIVVSVENKTCYYYYYYYYYYYSLWLSDAILCHRSGSTLAQVMVWRLTVELCAIIMGSKIVRYCLNNCRNWGGISIWCWIHKRHPTPYGVSVVNICEKIDHVIMAPHCTKPLLEPMFTSH